MQEERWGSREWQEAQFPVEQLDTMGDAWGMRWRGMEKLRHSSYLKMLRKVLGSDDAALNVLDIGCALCDFTVKAAALNARNRFWVTDIARNAVSWVKRRYPDFHCEPSALPDIPFDIQFDVVLCLEVLCYLDAKGRREAVARIHERLKPGGVLMFAGVLDDGRRYHTRDEVLELLGGAFSVESLSFNHWKFYKYVVEDPLDLLARALENRLHSETTPMPSLLRPVLRVAANTCKSVVGLRSLPEAFQFVSKMVRGVQDADEIVVLARKRRIDSPM